MSARLEPVLRVDVRDPKDTIGGLLAHLQEIVARNPEVAAGIYSHLVAEGERYAETPEGARARSRLDRSSLLRRASVLWDATTLWLLAARAEDTPPSALLDALFLGAESGAGEELLARRSGGR